MRRIAIRLIALLFVGWVAGATTVIAILLHGEFEQRHPMGGPKL